MYECFVKRLLVFMIERVFGGEQNHYCVLHLQGVWDFKVSNIAFDFDVWRKLMGLFHGLSLISNSNFVKDKSKHLI